MVYDTHTPLALHATPAVLGTYAQLSSLLVFWV